MQKKNFFIRLTRLTNSVNGTDGKLELFYFQKEIITCVFSCSTLEPSVPSLDAGQYILKFSHSPKLSSKEPYIKINNGKVPIISSYLKGESIEHRGLRIHCGNTSQDTNGCIIVGSTLGPDTYKLAHSRLTYISLMSFLQSANKELLLIINDETLPF